MLSRAFLQIGVPTMSRRNSRFLTVALLLWIGFGALGQAEAGGVLATPPGLKPGDQFRIVFATDGTTMATSTTITDYDKFVTNQAQGARTTAKPSNGWQSSRSSLPMRSIISAKAPLQYI